MKLDVLNSSLVFFSSSSLLHTYLLVLISFASLSRHVVSVSPTLLRGHRLPLLHRLALKMENLSRISVDVDLL